MRDYPISDTHRHAFLTRAIGRQAVHVLPHPSVSGVVDDLLPDLAAAGFARAIILGFTTTGEMREENVVREVRGTVPAQWGALEEQVDGMLADGRVIADDPRAEVGRDPQVREIYPGA